MTSRPITPEDKRRAVHAALVRHKRTVRITEGQRRAIIGSAEYRRGRKVER